MGAERFSRQQADDPGTLPQLGISERLLRSADNARKRFIYTGGQLHRLPENGPAFLKSKLISWPGKARLACEPLVPAKRDGEDETLADFARRRLGREALEKLIGPMVSGIFAGDPETMSLQSCFPRIHQLEQEYGGLIKAMVRLAKEKKKERQAGKVVASAAGPGGVLTSFLDGIQELTGGTAAPSPAATHRRRSGGDCRPGWRLRTAVTTGGSVEAELVVSAAPALPSPAWSRSSIRK